MKKKPGKLPCFVFFQESETMTELENIRSEVLSSNSKKSEVVTFHQQIKLLLKNYWNIEMIINYRKNSFYSLNTVLRIITSQTVSPVGSQLSN